MDGPSGYHANWNVRERQTLYGYSTCGIWKTKQVNKQLQSRKTHRYRMVAKGEEAGENKWNRWGRFRGINLQLQNKWVTGMKCTRWGI